MPVKQFPIGESGYEQPSEEDYGSHPIRNTCGGAQSRVVVSVEISCPSVPVH